MSNHFLNSIILLGIVIAQSIEASFVSPHSPICREIKHSFNYGPHFATQQQASTRRITVNMSNEGNILTSTLQPTTYIVVSAVILGVLIQGFINTMLKGDQGLSAFLSDGMYGYMQNTIMLMDCLR